MASPRVLVSWYIDPRYIGPFRLSEDQVTVGPYEGEAAPPGFHLRTPKGAYDLHACLEEAGIPTRFDLVVVVSDASGTNRPVNLGAFGCPVVLVAGDTHHLANPLSGLLAYAGEVRPDLLVTSYNRQHLHWFAAAGFANLAWLPGLIVREVPVSPVSDRHRQIAFVGQTGPYHPRRQRLVDALHAARLPILAGMAPLERALEVYAASLLSFNASLNGDLNLRVFEILSAGGCLVTDRLSPQSGLSLLLEEGRHMAAYGSAEELVEVARGLLAEPARALAMAEAGQRRWRQDLGGGRMARALVDFALDGRLDDRWRGRNDPRAGRAPDTLATRVAVYERLQEIHRTEEAPSIVVDADLPDYLLEDAADLHRLTMVRLDEAALGRRWDAYLCRDGRPPQPVDCGRCLAVAI